MMMMMAMHPAYNHHVIPFIVYEHNMPLSIWGNNGEWKLGQLTHG